jgi:glyoxylate/hydroxypyruvate reductase A
MRLLFMSSTDRVEDWRPAMAAAIPELEFRVWPMEMGRPEEIDYALVWQPTSHVLMQLKNLKAIFSLGAGVDHLLMTEGPLPDVPIVRLVDKALTTDMTQYVIHWVLHFHRGMHRHRESQIEGKWKRLPYPEVAKRRVGILGAGVLGSDAARKLAGFGFDVAVWSRTPKQIEGVQSYHGAINLIPFLGRSDILVCLLPLTAETKGILNWKSLLALPRGAFVINGARGAQVVDADLISALDSGHIEAAALDVFAPEPLPAGHAFWKHPRVFVTPHVASTTTARTAAIEIAGNIRRIEAGQAPTNVVDRTLKY